VQRALEGGVLHYATTPDPGELGNGAIFGHSSNNILNKGKYKFAFVLLKRLENGDTFYLQKDGKRYVYKVFDKKIVKPDDVSVLNSIEGRPATFSLITCDPPGTSINRLIVTGEQISPNPAANVASHVKQNNAEKPAVLPSNSPSLWSRLWGWLSS
ncbi:MAG TPA: class E sortase, partial [Chitinophagaceae bacterium]|nr:class E sortase [Chitinophagaceae bacterium]